VKPDDFELFAQYHLGILPDGSAHFQNLHELAKRYQVSTGQMQAWLAESKIDAVTADDTDYDLAGQHAEAQVMALLGDAAATLAFARQVYADYRARLGTKRVRTFETDDATVSDRVTVQDVPTKR